MDQTLRLSIDDEHDESLLLDLSRRFELTVYDAAYLEVAFRRSLPLATLDHRLRKAAEAMGIAVVQRHAYGATADRATGGGNGA